MALSLPALKSASDFAFAAIASRHHRSSSPESVSAFNPLRSTIAEGVSPDAAISTNTSFAVFANSMPASIEAFVAARLPAATRVEFCHNERHVLIRRGWELIAEGCEAGPGDTLIVFD